MYGWFQYSGESDKFFQNTIPEDIILRTSFLTNKLVFGNDSSSLAGMYIHDNRIGVKRIPEFDLDCAGITRTTELRVSDTFVLDDKKIHLRNENNAFFFNGVLNNKVVLADIVKRQRHILRSTEIIDVQQIDEENFQIQLIIPDSASIQLPFYENEDILQIETGLYQYPLHRRQYLSITYSTLTEYSTRYNCLQQPL
jgi:hypothetical protein